MAEPWYQIAKTVSIPPVRFWFDLRIEGLEHIPATGPAIVACNHVSYLDPLTNANAVMKAGRRPRFLAKRDLFEIPVVGSAFRGANQIPVQRGRGDQTPLLLAEEALAGGEVVVIYPEGTVTKREDHLPMDGKTGTIRLSLASGVPIVPLASWGSQAVWQKSGPGSLKFGRSVWTTIGTPIDVTARRDEVGDREAVKAMTADLMAHLTEMVQGLRARYPERWSDGG
ncbi:MAG: lysophospholipid acyltransferase family protein [Actinomycetota bacterium]